MNTHNLPIDAGNYDKVYSDVIDNESAAGKKSTGEVLESLYEKFNLRHPADFRGHSLSVSDVVVLHDNGVVTAHYCDSYGFTQIPEFVQPDAFVNLDSSGIAVSGHYGTWHTLESHNIQGQNFYLMESDEFGSDAANVIVDGTGKLVAEDVLTGFTPDIIQMITEEQQLAPHLTNVMQEEGTQRRQAAEHIAEAAAAEPGKRTEILPEKNYLKAAEEYQEENYNCIDGNLFTQNKLTPGDDTLSQPEQIPDRATSAKDRSSVIGRLKAAQEKLPGHPRGDRRREIHFGIGPPGHDRRRHEAERQDGQVFSGQDKRGDHTPELYGQTLCARRSVRAA